MRHRPPSPPDYTHVYRRAAKLLVERGWCHQGGMTRTGAMCLLIAITTAADEACNDGQNPRAPVLHAARHVAPAGRNGSAYSLIAYNDAPERTEDQVLDLLDQLSR